MLELHPMFGSKYSTFELQVHSTVWRVIHALLIFVTFVVDFSHTKINACTVIHVHGSY